MPLILGRAPYAPPPPPVVPTDDPGAVLWLRGDAGITLTSGLVSGWANQVVGGGAWGSGAQTNAARRFAMGTVAGKATPVGNGVATSVNFSIPNVQLPAFTAQVVSSLAAPAAATQTLFDVSDDFSFPDRGPRMFQTTTQRVGTQLFATTVNVGYAFNATGIVVHTFTCQAALGVPGSVKTLYANGVQVAQVVDGTGEGNPRFLLTGRFGARSANNQGFNGPLPELAIWDNVLAPARVLAQASGALGRWS